VSLMGPSFGVERLTALEHKFHRGLTRRALGASVLPRPEVTLISHRPGQPLIREFQTARSYTQLHAVSRTVCFRHAAPAGTGMQAARNRLETAARLHDRGSRGRATSTRGHNSRICS